MRGTIQIGGFMFMFDAKKNRKAERRGAMRLEMSVEIECRPEDARAGTLKHVMT
jgi:hypothetical protein